MPKTRKTYKKRKTRKKYSPRTLRRKRIRQSIINNRRDQARKGFSGFRHQQCKGKTVAYLAWKHSGKKSDFFGKSQWKFCPGKKSPKSLSKLFKTMRISRKKSRK